MDPSFRSHNSPPPSYVRPDMGQTPAYNQQPPGNPTVSPQPMPPGRRRPVLMWLLVVVLMAGAAAGGYFYAKSKKTTPVASSSSSTSGSDLLPSNQQGQTLIAYGSPLALKTQWTKTTVTLPVGAHGIISTAQPASLGADTFMPPNILNDFLGAFLIAPALPNVTPLPNFAPEFTQAQDSSIFVYDATAWSQSAAKDPKAQAPNSSTPAQKKAWLDGLVATKQTQKCDLTKNSLGEFGGNTYLATSDGNFVGCFRFSAAGQAPGLDPLVAGDLVYQAQGRTFLIDFTYRPKVAVMYTSDNTKPENTDKAQIQAKYKTYADMPEAKAFIDSLQKTTFELVNKPA